MARAVGVACKEKEMSKWPEILWDGWIDDVAFIAKLFLSGIWYDAEEEEDQEGDDSRSSADGEDVDESEESDDVSEYGEEVDYGDEEDEGIEDESEEDEDDEGTEERSYRESDLEGQVATRKRLKLAKKVALRTSLDSGCYPEYKGFEGPYDKTDPASNSSLDFLTLLWPDSLYELLVVETNRYAHSKARQKWVDVNKDDILTFLAIIVLMGVNRPSSMSDFWSSDDFLGVAGVQRHMSVKRFWAIWANLHVVDSKPGDSFADKIKPVLDVLSCTFFSSYSAAQELSVDEAMCKYKGRARGKVRMPKKPIKCGYKIWCCCCACCGYLCTFQVYQGCPRHPLTGEKVPEKGMVMRVVKQLLAPFPDLNHVVYADNYFTSGPLVEALAKESIYLAGTIKQTAAGYPVELRNVKLDDPGDYAVLEVGKILYTAYKDGGLVSFVTNAFPSVMPKVPKRQTKSSVIKHVFVPPVSPAYNKFMGGVDRLSQSIKCHGFDRKSKRSWIRLFFKFFDYAIHNAYLLYKHNCRNFGVKRRSMKKFRMELVHLLAKDTRRRVRKRPFSSVSDDHEGPCSLERVAKIGLVRGRCKYCTLIKRDPIRSTSFGCDSCLVRLCTVDCFRDYHLYFT